MYPCTLYVKEGVTGKSAGCPAFLPIGRGGEGGNGLPQWSQSRPYDHICISRKPRPQGGELYFLPALLPIPFDWSLPEFAADKAKRKMKVILKDASGKTLGSDVSNKVFRIKIGSVE